MATSFEFHFVGSLSVVVYEAEVYSNEPSTQVQFECGSQYRLGPLGRIGSIYRFHDFALCHVQQQQVRRRLASSGISLHAIALNPQRGKLRHQGHQIHATMLEAAAYCGFRNIVPSSHYASPHTCKVQLRRDKPRIPHVNLNAAVRSVQQLARDAARAQRGFKGEIQAAFNRTTQQAKAALPRSAIGIGLTQPGMGSAQLASSLIRIVIIRATRAMPYSGIKGCTTGLPHSR
jgi:hypothetical protein